MDESTTWISVEVSREESPLGESSRVIMGEVDLGDFFLLLLALTKPITPSVAWEPEGAAVIWLGCGKSWIFSYKVPDCVYTRYKYCDSAMTCYFVTKTPLAMSVVIFGSSDLMNHSAKIWFEMKIFTKRCLRLHSCMWSEMYVDVLYFNEVKSSVPFS